MPEQMLLSAIHERQPKIVANEANDRDPKWPLHELMGVEIETEDFAYANEVAEELHDYWTTHHDGSLRNGTEWVTRYPFAGKALTTAINMFFAKRRAYNMSERTSTHIHINMTDENLTLDQFRSLFCLAFIIDPAVFRIADENRKWCSYCCPLTDMSEERLSTLLSSDKKTRIMAAINGDKNEDKYYGFNVVSLRKHGTLEFRHFSCTQDKEQLESWIKLVQEIKKTGISFDNPKVMLEMMNTPDNLALLIRARMPQSAELVLRYLDRDDAVERARYLTAVIANKPIQDQALRANPAAPAYDRLRKKLIAKKPAAAKPKQPDAPYVKQVVAAAVPNADVIDAWKKLYNATQDEQTREAIKLIIEGLKARD